MEHYSPVRRGLQWEAAGKPAGGRGPQGRPPSAGERGLRPLCFGPGPKRPAGPKPSPSAHLCKKRHTPRKPPPPAPADRTPSPAGRFGSAETRRLRRRRRPSGGGPAARPSLSALLRCYCRSRPRPVNTSSVSPSVRCTRPAFSSSSTAIKVATSSLRSRFSAQMLCRLLLPRR